MFSVRRGRQPLSQFLHNQKESVSLIYPDNTYVPLHFWPANEASVLTVYLYTAMTFRKGPDRLLQPHDMTHIIRCEGCAETKPCSIKIMQHHHERDCLYLCEDCYDKY